MITGKPPESTATPPAPAVETTTSAAATTHEALLLSCEQRVLGCCPEEAAAAAALALAAARPGASCGSVDAAARAVISEAGYGPDYRYFTHRLGHGIGMDGHEWPYLVRGNSTALRAGMTTSNEPGIYIRGEFGVRLEDDMVVTELGAELLTPQSVSLEDPFGRA